MAQNAVSQTEAAQNGTGMLLQVPENESTSPVEHSPRPQTGPRGSTLARVMKIRGATSMSRLRDLTQSGHSFTMHDVDSDSSLSEADQLSPLRPGRAAPADDGVEAPKRTEDVTPPPMKRQSSYSRFAVGNEFYRSQGKIDKADGRINISVNEAAGSGYIAKALGQPVKHHFNIPHRHPHHYAEAPLDGEAEDIAASMASTVKRPHLNIVILIIGSRGDIQPFLRVGKILRNNYGHRVRIATHPVFKDFVESDAGLEFFSIGGDPSELMAFMVKNPGLIPKLETIREGEIRRRRSAMAEMFDGMWNACISPTDDEHNHDNLDFVGNKAPFIADAIIANPPSMAHIHIAEKLGVPLHMMFTFPYTPTQQFPHPIANIVPNKSNVDAHYVNFMSYPLVEGLTWQGLGDIVNHFRTKTLELAPVSALWAPNATYRAKVPYSYMWSPALCEKSKDWGPEIDITGFVFLDLASNFTPPKALADFLDAGEPPIYVGFGSIVVDDPNAFTEMIFEACKKAGVRALVNKGWGGFGKTNADTPSNIFMLENTPHDWLFPRVKAVVHHGGAGTTAIGLKLAKPTMIVPFFGDQPFWGGRVAAAKAGAHQCIPYKTLTIDQFVEGIKQCLTKEAQENVQRIADRIALEGDGAENAVKSFHRSLPLAGRHNMRCSILQDRAAVWQLRKSFLRLSALAADILHETGKIRWEDLKLLRHYKWADFDGPGEPITGGVAAVKDSLFDIGQGFGMVPVHMAKHIEKHSEQQRKRQAIEVRKKERERQDASMKDNSVIPAATKRPQATRDETSATVNGIRSEALPKQLAEDVGSGLKKSGMALVTLPNDLFFAVVQGFHNAPRLWGDVSVRKPVRITGFKSGCTAARNEFTHGIYDAWTGLITQPVGAWEDADSTAAKVASLPVGLGKGIGGFVLKNLTAVIGPPAYIGRGVIQYLEKKSQSPGVKEHLRIAHIIQGQKDVSALKAMDEQGSATQLKEAQAQVEKGWKIYEEIWDTVNQHFASGLIGTYKFGKERHKWDINGAFENVDTAERTLHALKSGEDLEKLFARRRKEMVIAGQLKVGAMGDARDSGPVAVGDAPVLEKETRKFSLGDEADSSDETAVATPPESQVQAGDIEKLERADIGHVVPAILASA